MAKSLTWRRSAHSLLYTTILSLMPLVGCGSSTLRPPAGEISRTETHAISPDTPTPIRMASLSQLRAHPHLSGFELLPRGEDALKMRIALIESAAQTIDMQYYSIEDDATDQLLLEAIMRAADRGVRVRILMDDLNFRSDDHVWSLLNSDPHVQVRIFNPFTTREETLGERIEDVFTGIGHFTRRMHNKMLVVDNQAAVTGGRNLGAPYFNESDDMNFHDLDMFAIGPITSAISTSFDRYWNSQEAFPITQLIPPQHSPLALKQFRQLLKDHWSVTAADKDSLIPSESVTVQLKQSMPLIWANSSLAADSPTKIDQDPAHTQSKPGERLEALVNQAQHEFIAVTPYFVPGDDGVKWLTSLTARGVAVHVLTNSLASTDAIAAHTGYRPYREAMVKGGIDLYEMKPVPGRHPHSTRYGSNAPTSLHTKIYVIDRKTVVIGSFNFDQRSLNLNTEAVIVVQSPAFAEQIVQWFTRATAPDRSYHVVLDNGSLVWKTDDNGQEKDYSSDPHPGFWRSIKTDLIGLFPIENQL